MKEYLKDYNGKVKLCESNVCKMNIFEFMYYSRNIMIEDVIGIFKEFCELIPEILSFIFLPVLYPVIAFIRIRNAKKEMKRYKDRVKFNE